MAYHIGDVLDGKVTGIQPYGAFVSLDEEIQGLIHISECKHGYVKDIESVLHVGQEVKVVVLDIDEYSGKISLSIRGLSPDPNVSEHRHKKHYWTNRHVHEGFNPIAKQMPGWLDAALDDLNKRGE